MCGRYPGVVSIERTAARFGAVIGMTSAERFALWEANYNTAPTQRVAAVVLANGRPELECMHWGWKAPWMKGVLVNARSETAATKRTFATALRDRRCIIPACGFYEWKTEGRIKVPFLFQVAGEEIAGLAGLWVDETDDTGTHRRCLPLTTEANQLVAPIHDRMAVILRREDEARWLDPSTPLPQLLAACRPFPAEGMTAHQVSTAVNQVRNKGSDLIVAVA